MEKKNRILKNIPDDDSAGHAPPGQFVTEKFPVLTFGDKPDIDLGKWRISVSGLVKNEHSFSLRDFLALGQTEVEAEFHCVTQWSKLHNLWEGVLFSVLADKVSVLEDAKFFMVHCYGGYSTNLSLEVLMDEDVLFATKHDGIELNLDHGGPVRLVVPKRYGWKSAKWVKGVEFMNSNRPGFWEQRGYHMDGDPWKEERFV